MIQSTNRKELRNYSELRPGRQFTLYRSLIQQSEMVPISQLDENPAGLHIPRTQVDLRPDRYGSWSMPDGL
ncbi:hypothetical protein HYQ45_013646 [Verticillium longisporum]|uniref:Uncharacterized protein n=1 Tax=Verticillium longisporum TaxID=100787 RepID=A0A8I3AMN7_VERLO|nr:hypothetical protein HYQ44_005227 [Verticillium longisporum]KAG7124463.1 hypothetical protein HYQ45_013646 [Verticillium longisporum]